MLLAIAALSVVFLATTMLVLFMSDLGKEPTDNIKYDVWSDQD